MTPKQMEEALELVEVLRDIEEARRDVARLKFEIVDRSGEGILPLIESQDARKRIAKLLALA